MKRTCLHRITNTHESKIDESQNESCEFHPAIRKTNYFRMKTIMSFCVFFLLSFMLSAQVNPSVYIDFGPSDVTNGNVTVSPDKNGNYWNNATVAKTIADTLKIVDKLNAKTSAFMLVTKDFSGTNGILNGGLLDPAEALLGEFAINTATQDFFYTDGSGSISFGGLNLSKKYVFKLFGSRTNTEIRKTEFTITGATSYIGTLQTSGTNLGGTGININTSTVLVSDTIAPAANGHITIDIKKVAGSFAFLNVMKIEVYNAPAPPAKPVVLIDFGKDDAAKGMHPTLGADANGNYWNNMLLWAKSNPMTANDTLALVNSKNEATGCQMAIATDFFGLNGGSGAGGLITPDAAFLNELAIATATEDYIYGPGKLTFSKLNTSKGYVFHMFGSRANAEIRKTEFVIKGKNESRDTLQTSGTDLGGAGINQNSSKIAVSDTIIPDENGVISFQLNLIAGNHVHLNVLKIESFDVKPVVPVSEKDTIKADNRNFQFMGRVDFTDPKKPLFAYANTSIKTKFQGTSVELLLKQYAGANFSDNSFYAIIDGGTPIKVVAKPAVTSYAIADSLTDALHSLEIIKITEGYCGQCQFLGLLLDKGKTVEAADAKPALKIEFYGASSTGGYGIEGGNRPDSDNSYKADPAVCARQLNSQLHVVSLSGFGMVVGWSATSTIGTIWDKTVPVASTPAPANNNWDFTQYTPDVVVVELGTNDYNAPGGFKEKLTVDQFKDGYDGFIANLRSKYPSSKIVCANSYMLPDPGFKVVSDAVKSLVNTENAKGDYNVYYFGFAKMLGGGYNGHPGVADGTNNGKAMADFIQGTVLAHDGKTDITAPVITALMVDNINEASAIAHVTTDDAGTVYYAVLSSSATKPDAAAIIAGTSADFVAKGSADAIAASVKDVDLAGLSSVTSYKVYAVVKDVAGNVSEVSSIPFKTLNKTSVSTISGSKVSVYPNPATNNLFITISESTEVATIEIFSVEGRTLFTLTTQAPETVIPVSKLNASGIVLVKVSTNKGTSVSRILLK